MSLSGLPFDDIRNLIAELPAFDERAKNLAEERCDSLAAHFGQLGEFGKHMPWLAGWTGKSPLVTRPLIALFAGTHGITSQMEDISGEKTIESVTLLAAGGSPVNQVCASHDIGLKVFDLALQYPVDDITTKDALDEKGAAGTIGFGMEAIAGGVDVLGLAAIGQGSEISNAALLSLLLDKPAQHWLETIDQKFQAAYIDLADKAIERNRESLNDPLELLRRLGGREHLALAGAILAARTNHVAVILNGLSAIAVAVCLSRLADGACDHCLVATSHHQSEIDAIGCGQLFLDSGNINDGSGAALALGLLKTYANVHSNSKL